MKQIFKFFISKAIATKNKTLAEMTDPGDIQSLLQRLYPVSCDKELIRLGPKGDGGYLVPNDLEGIEACFSPGVDCVSGFEKDCADLGMKAFLADKSVEQPGEAHELFHFTQKYVGTTTSDDFMTMDDWVASSLPGSESDLLLEMDIEGYEYEVFLSMSDKLMRRFRIIIVEFHHLEKFWHRLFFNLAGRAFEKLLQTHTCVHIHPNNTADCIKKGDIEIPQVLEFTFLRNDRIADSAYQRVFPHPLDYENSNNPPLPLPKCWYAWDKSCVG